MRELWPVLNVLANRSTSHRGKVNDVEWSFFLEQFTVPIRHVLSKLRGRGAGLHSSGNWGLSIQVLYSEFQDIFLKKFCPYETSWKRLNIFTDIYNPAWSYKRMIYNTIFWWHYHSNLFIIFLMMYMVKCIWWWWGDHLIILKFFLFITV